MTKSPYEIILRPVVTETSTQMAEAEQPHYVFEVPTRATKPEIRWAIEKIYNVKVSDVRTVTLKGKVKRVRYRAGRRPDRKKAIISLAEGQRLDIY